MSKESEAKSKSKKVVETIDYIEDCQTATAQQPLSATPLIPAAILGSTAVMVVLLILWMALTEIDIRTTGIAVAKPATPTRMIQNINGGRVKEILVKAGDQVKANQVLVTLDDTQYQAQYKAENIRRAALQAQVARLNALIHQKDAIEFPTGFANKYPEMVKTEQALFEAERHRLKSAVANQEKRKAAAEKELEMMRPLVKKQVLAKIEETKMEVKVTEIQGEINSLINDALAKASTELNKKSNELQELNAAIKQLEDKIFHSKVKSPIDGFIIERNVNTIGGVVKPDTTMFTINPTAGTLRFKVDVVPEQIGFVRKDQDAIIQIKAYDYTIYGQLKGKVSRISPDTVQNAERANIFKVTVDVDDPNLYYNGQTLKIKPGMTANVHIVTNRSSMLNYIMKPFVKTFREAIGQR